MEFTMFLAGIIAFYARIRITKTFNERQKRLVHKKQEYRRKFKKNDEFLNLTEN